MAIATLNANKDVSFSEQYDKIYNGQNMLYVGGNTGYRYYALINFSNFLSTIKANAGEKKITSAKLTVTKIQGKNAQGENVGFKYAFDAVAQRVTSSWSDTSGSWSNRPSATTTGQSPAVTMGEGHSGTVTFDVTSIVQAWANGSSQYGIQIIPNENTADRLKTLASDNAFITVTYEDNTTKTTAPTSISANKSIITPNGKFIVNWSGAASGTNNKITTYQVYWKVGAAPTTSDYDGTANVNVVDGTPSGSKEITLSNAARGKKVYVGIVTRGSAGASYYSNIKTASVVTINTLPSAPTVTVNTTDLISGGTPKFKITAGKTNNSGQTASIWYSTSSSSTKIELTSESFSPTVTSTITYYFYTYDGLEYSSATSKKITVHAKPTTPKVSVSASTVKSSGGEVTFTVTAGTSTYGTTSIYYATSSSGTKTKFTSPLKITVTKTTTYYFYTYDGLQYSSSVSQKITVNTIPKINSITVSPTILTPSSTSQVNSLVNKVSLKCSISETSVSYKWYAATGTNANEVSTKITNANNSISTGNYKNILTEIHSSASASNMNLSSKISEGVYYQIGLIVSDGYDFSSFKWLGTTYQIPKKPKLAISSISCPDPTISNTVPAQTFEEKICIVTSEKNVGVGYPKITSCVPMYSYTNATEKLNYSNYTFSEKSNKITFTITTAHPREAKIKLGLKYSDSSDTIYESTSTQVWTRASAASFSGGEIHLTTGDGEDVLPVRPYSKQQFTFDHPEGNNTAAYRYKLNINNKDIDITNYLNLGDNNTKNVNQVDKKLENENWEDFNKSVSNSVLNSSYEATLYVYPRNAFGIEGKQPLTKTVYFNYIENPEISSFSVDQLKTPAGNILKYGTNGFGISGGLTNNNLQFQNGDTLCFKVKMNDANNDITKVHLYCDNKILQSYSADSIQSNGNYNIIEYKVLGKKNKKVIFSVVAEDSLGNTSTLTENNKVGLYWTTLNAPSIAFSVSDIITDSSVKEEITSYKTSFKINYKNLNFGNSTIEGKNTLERYSITTSEVDSSKVKFTLKYLNNDSWEPIESIILTNYEIPKDPIMEFVVNDKIYEDTAEIANLQLEIEVLYDYHITDDDQKIIKTNKNTFTAAYYFEAPTISHRKNRIGINTKTYNDKDVFVIKRTSSNYIIRLVGEGKEISIDLSTLTIDGSTIDGGTWD